MTLTFFGGRRIRIAPELRDHLLITLWIVVTFKQFRNDELILYPLALYFFWAFVRDFPALFDLLARSLIVFAFPVWYFLSVSWGTETVLILKSGLQLLLTFMICYCAVHRLGPRQIMLSVLVAASLFGVLSVLQDPSGGKAARGVFSSKNALGTSMVILWVAALCVALDDGFGRWIRLAAAAAALLSLRLINVSDSATAVLLALGAGAMVLVLRGSRSLSGVVMVTFLALGCGAAALLLAGVAMTVPDIDPVGDVLAAFGKDSTLTGRTVLWDYARREIAERPLLGVGTGGFWTPYDGLSQARLIYDTFHKAPHANFSFHNSYFEIAVHQGLIGLALAVMATAWCLARILLVSLRNNSVPAIFFLCIAMITLARSFTESGLMSPFALLSMLLVIGALFAIKAPSGIADADATWADVVTRRRPA